jgi:large subunit ribosomal protein L6
MSKIGRKPIALNGVQVDIKGQEIHYKGKKNTGVFELSPLLEAEVASDVLRLIPAKDRTVSARDKRDLNRVWGLNYALLKNKISGARQEFELPLQINGLGYKAVAAGASKVVFSLGYSHKIDFPLPAGVAVDIDAKTGQRLTLRSVDNVLLGQVASRIRELRPPECYKGTGIKFASQVIFRKSGKTKSS